MIFYQISINNTYLEIKIQVLSTNFAMYFHIIGIKEDKNNKYNIDMILESDSESFVKDFLHSHNIVLLNFSQYKDPIQNFGNLELFFDYKNQKIRAISCIDDIYIATKQFILVWFDLIYINFLWSSKIKNEKASQIIQDCKIDVSKIKTQQEEEIKNKKEYQKKMYKDAKLQKALKFTESSILQVTQLLDTVSNYVSPNKIREINIMVQSLTKLRKWRNVDKILEILEKLYHKYYEIQDDYIKHLSSQNFLPIPWSYVSYVDILSEANKLQKAFNIKNIGGKRDSNDNYYLSFEFLWAYIKLLIKDIKYTIKNIKKTFYRIFTYFETTFLITILLLSIIFWFHKISYSINDILYLYVFTSKIWILGLSFYFFKKLRKTKISSNILLVCASFIVSYLVFWLIRVNLSF